MRYSVKQSELHDEPIEPGEYPARIDRIGHRTSNAGNPCMLVNWTLTGTDPPSGTKLLESITMTPESYWRLGELFKALDFKPDEDGFDDSDLTGMECLIAVEMEEYQGVERPRVKYHKTM